MMLFGPQMNAAADLLHARIGLKPDPSFRRRLARAVRDTAAEQHVDRDALIRLLHTDEHTIDALVERVTVQETGFFRHPEQFDAAAEHLLPTMAAPWNAWSAACANGQEAYSLAMLLRENAPADGPPPSVLATDISPAAVARTVAGRYSERELAGVNATRRSVHFTNWAADEFDVRPTLRRTVRVQRHNLVDSIPDEVAACQIVMCRNVLIYFSAEHAEGFLRRLAAVMRPDAYLFIGGAEMLWQLTDRFEPVQLGNCFAYRPRSKARPRTTVPTPLTTQVATPASSSGEVNEPAQRAVQRAAVPRAAVQRVSVPPRTHRQEPTVAPSDQPGDLERRGRSALALGDTSGAVIAFRQWAYLTPDDPLAHFHLGSALHDASAEAEARRAYRAALAALDRSRDDQISEHLHGYDPSELRRLLADRCLETT